MSNSLRDQLIGLGFKAAPRPERASKPRPDKNKPRKPSGGKGAGKAARVGGDEIDLAKAYALRTQQEKRERQRAEQQRQEEARARKLARAKLAELLKDKAQNAADADIPRHFEYGGKIRRVYLTREQLRAVNAGELGVVQSGGSYVLVDAAVAREAAALVDGALALLVDPAAEDATRDDAQASIPDDLVW